MVGNTLADSMAITASRRTFELTRRRAITTEDMGYMLNLAMPPHNAREVVVKYWVEILGQPELTPFRLTNKEAEPSGTISCLSGCAKKDSFAAL